MLGYLSTHSLPSWVEGFFWGGYFPVLACPMKTLGQGITGPNRRKPLHVERTQKRGTLEASAII